MDSDKTKQIHALRSLLEECRNRAVDLEIETVVYLMSMAETSIADYLVQLEDPQNSSCQPSCPPGQDSERH